jgi:cephalosporin hydroxylase
VTSSLDAETVSHLRDVCAEKHGPLMILLDDWHGGEHVEAELDAYAPLLKEGDILIVADTSFADLAGTPIAPFKSLAESNPRTALHAFLAKNPSYELTSQYSPQGISNFADGCIQLKRK